MTGKLYGSLAYLCGPIERANDLGVSWRDKFIEQTKEIGVRILNPCNKPPSCMPEIKEGQRIADEIRIQEDWPKMQSFAKTIRREDLRFVDICDFLVIYINRNIYTVGSWDELFVAESQRKPVLAIVEGGIKYLPTWLFAVFELHEVFDSVESCVSYLLELNDGQKEMDRRWFLIRDYLQAS